MRRPVRSLLSALALVALAAVPVVAAPPAPQSPAAHEVADRQLTAQLQQLQARLKPSAHEPLVAAHEAWLAFRDADGEYHTFGLADPAAATLAHAGHQAERRVRDLAWWLAKTSPKPVAASGQEIGRLAAIEKQEHALYKEVRRHLGFDEQELLVIAEGYWARYRDAASAPALMAFRSGHPAVSRIGYRIRLTETRMADLQAELKRLKSLPG
ncbi:MAG: lysozyme inhibitor LprI family protein [Candidatus Sericytochromatia bacterium]